jgi:hypothetical protein
MGTATYLGNKGTDVLTTTFVNLVNPQTGVAPYPAFGPVSRRGNVGKSTFHALQGNARRAFQNGFLLSANYMWSHSINDGSIGGGESDTPPLQVLRQGEQRRRCSAVIQLLHRLPVADRIGKTLHRHSGAGADNIRRLDVECDRKHPDRSAV